MKQKAKWFISGFLLCVMVFGAAIPAGAAIYEKAITAYYREIKITIDGQQVVPKDVNGNPIEPFLSEGTTYLPIRGIASALGLDVAWDNDTKTVSLSTEGNSNAFDGSIDSFLDITRGKVMTAVYKEYPDAYLLTEQNVVFLDDMRFYAFSQLVDQPDTSAVEGEFYVENGYLNLMYGGPLVGETVRDIYKINPSKNGFSLEYVSGGAVIAPDVQPASYQVDGSMSQYDVRMKVESTIG